MWILLISILLTMVWILLISILVDHDVDIADQYPCRP